MVLLTVDWLLPSLRAAAEKESRVAASANAAKASRDGRMAEAYVKGLPIVSIDGGQFLSIHKSIKIIA